MKKRTYKIISGILYGMLFGFAVMLFTACILLGINTFSPSSERLHTNIEAIVISGGDEQAENGFDSIEEYSANSSKAYLTQDMTFGYKALGSANERYLYNMIKQNVYLISSEPDDMGHYSTDRFTVRGENMSEQSIRRAVNAFLSDNPQVFWLENLFGYAYEGDDTVVECYSVLSAEECTKYIKSLNSKIDKILEKIDYTLSDYEKEKAVHDMVLEGVSYKHGVDSSSDGWQYFSAYGALVDGEAVCEGYAKAMQIILIRVGIPCYTVRGEAGDVGHMWNLVELDGDWYHLDPTWDDDENGINYEYFNLSTYYAENTHKINELAGQSAEEEENSARYNFFLPECDTMKLNYYHVEGIEIGSLDGYEDDKIIDFIVKNVSEDKPYLPIIFDGDNSYDEYMNNFFYESPYRFYYYIDRANEKLDSQHKIDRNSIHILKNESAGTLRIRFGKTEES